VIDSIDYIEHKKKASGAANAAEQHIRSLRCGHMVGLRINRHHYCPETWQAG
jgi:hypothetical protein